MEMNDIKNPAKTQATKTQQKGKAGLQHHAEIFLPHHMNVHQLYKHNSPVAFSSKSSKHLVWKTL